jgi:uncharacterized membrane protein
MLNRRMPQTLICLLLLFLLTSVSCSKQPAYPEPSVEGSDIRIRIHSLQPEIPQFFTYDYEGKKINFFVITVNGETQSYFDACKKCNPRKLGYRYHKGELICRACNMAYPVDELGGIGSCYPITLEGSSQDGFYVIKHGNIISGQTYF